VGSLGLFKKVVLYFFVAGIPWSAFFYIIHHAVAYYVSLVSLLLLVVCYFFSNQFFFNVFKALFFLVISLDLVVYDHLLGQQSMVAFVMLALMLLPFILYTENRGFMSINVAIPILAFCLLHERILDPWVQPIGLLDSTQHILAYATFFTALGAIIAACVFAKNNIVKLQKVEKELLESEINSIKKIVVTLSHNINNLLVSIVSGSALILKTRDLEVIYKIGAQINTNGQAISTVMKTLSKVEKPVTSEYIQGVDMIDLEKSV
jgi:hypothetical protein